LPLSQIVEFGSIAEIVFSVITVASEDASYPQATTRTQMSATSVKARQSKKCMYLGY
jgi:hypothetical protein